MALRVWAEVWCEVDPTLNVRVDRATGRPAAEAGDRLTRVSPLGRAAVAAALKLENAEVTAFALGGGHADALRHALAAGASRGVEVLIEGDDPDAVPLESLAEWLRQERPDLVLAARWAGVVAGRLGWAHLAGLDQLRVDGGALRAVRFLERGHRERVTARLPALVRLQDESVRVPYVARARIEAVKDRPLTRVTLPAAAAQAIETGPLQPARPRARLGAAPRPAASSGSSRLQALLGGAAAAAVAAPAGEKAPATPEQMAEDFVRYLIHHQLLPER